MTPDEQILAIYNIYPRKVGRRAALKAIEAAISRIVPRHKGTRKDASTEEDFFIAARRWLWKRTAEYAASPAGQDPPKGHPDDYRPHPATFYNQERYLDDPREWQRPNGGYSNGKANGTSNNRGERALDALSQAIGGGRVDHAGSDSPCSSEDCGIISPIPPADGGPIIEGTFESRH